MIGRDEYGAISIRLQKMYGISSEYSLSFLTFTVEMLQGNMRENTVISEWLLVL